MKINKYLKTRSVAAVVAAASLAFASGCSNSGVKESGYVGVVRETPLLVKDVSLKEVTNKESRADGIVQDGELLMRAREGRLLVVYFGFTSCPDVCPTTLADFKIALKNMSAIERDKVDFAFVTVDPARDTAEILNSYMGHFIDRYHVVRDEPDAIKEAADAFLASYSVTGTGDDTSVSHTAILYAIDSQGSARIEWPFGTDGKSMASDMTKLLSTMGGTSADR